MNLNMNKEKCLFNVIKKHHYNFEQEPLGHILFYFI